MPRYKKLLVAFDGSPSSENALRQAFRLAEAERSWIKVLAVVPSYEGDIDMTGVKDIEAVLRGPAEKLIAKAKEIAAQEKVNILTNIEQGEAYETIIEVAEEENCDLIVMGRRGIRHVERMLMGSVTARVVGHSNKDVLIIPRDSALGWKTVLLATDGSTFSESAAKKAIDFALLYGSKLTAVSVLDITDEFHAEAPAVVDKLIDNAKATLGNVRTMAESSGLTIETFIKEGEPYEKITQLAKEKNADVIFLGSHGRTGLARLLMGSVAEKVIGYAPCPVLISKS